MQSAEKQYLFILKDILANGSKVFNERTGTNCLVSLNHTIYIPTDTFPLITTRKAFWKQAIGEMLAYIRGYTKLEDFHKLGVNTWDKNAEGWYQDTSGSIINPNALIDYESYSPSVGLIYGASAKEVGTSYEVILNQIKNTPNDRGIIWNFWNPEYFHLGCLRPCMYSHQFNVLDGKLHLTSTSRSMDMPLGGAFNIVQCWFLAHVTAKLTGYEVGSITLNIVNAHIYENQIIGVLEQLKRVPNEEPNLYFIKDLNLKDVMEKIDFKNINTYFSLLDYKPYPAINYPFTK